MTHYLYTRMLLLSTICMVLVNLNSCKEDRGIGINKVGDKPGVVSNVRITPISGGAIIKYDLPISEDLRYVKAIYKLDNGVERESKSSIYANEILVDGFGKEGEYDIELRSVALGEVESEAIIVKVNALRPPHILVLDKMLQNNNIAATFGGFNVTYFNETRANIIIRIIRKNDLGEWESVDNAYTNFTEGTIRVRGQEAKPTEFGIFIEDRWDHMSDTLFMNLNPIEEVAIPSTRFARFILPNDAEVRASGFPFNGIWDGNVNAGYLSTTPNIELPNSITIDLGIPVILSRMQIWATRVGTLSDIYGASHMYDFEIYGSNSPNPTGEWDDSWESLGRFVSQRPTGFGFGVPATTAEQTLLRDQGETYEFPDPTAYPKYRYMRIRNYSTWSGSYEGSSNFFIFELKLFGQI